MITLYDELNWLRTDARRADPVENVEYGLEDFAHCKCGARFEQNDEVCAVCHNILNKEDSP